MKRRMRTAASVAVICLLAAPVAAQTTGPKATYWVDAATTTGMGGMMGAMMGGQGGYGGGYDAQAMAAQQEYEQPSSAAVIGGALAGDAGTALGGLFGGGKKKQKAPANPGRRAEAPRQQAQANWSRTLNLHLGATQKPPAPSAEHLPPAGLDVGPSLPLVTPVSQPTSTTYDPQHWQGQKPRGKMMIYWGCGEHAAAPPIVIDFAKMGPGMKAPPFPTIVANPGTPPAPGKNPTYGEWPNAQSSTPVPANGSLVGAHTVRGNYTPEIHFTVDPGHDFLAPLNVSSSPSAGGGTMVTWNSVPNATGYYAWMMGAGGQDETMVMWSSSATAAFMGALMDYLPPSEVRRLIAARAVMPPSTTSCVVPTEVTQIAPMGMLSMIAYGDELNVSNPPKPAKGPWNIDYTVKLRLKSTGMTMIGMPGMGR
jgi:hypothetical protein